MASRGLGTLTIDLVARTSGFVQGMDKAERSSKKWRRQVEKDMKVVKDRTVSTLKAGAASAITFATATAALTKTGMAAVESQARFAKSLGTTYDSVTQLREAFGDSGIDDFEASMNRLNRRLGAAELGRGAAVNAVKELKLDLQELAQVDAAERVAIIADRIKDVATNSQTAARYAQDLGFEQREAAAFFLQGGDAVRAYSEQVEVLGLSLSDIDAQKVIDAQNAMGAFGDITTAVSQKLASNFAPLLKAASEELNNVAIEAGGVGVVVDDVFDRAVVGGIRTAASFRTVFNQLTSSLGDIWSGYQSLPPWAQEIGIVGALVGGKKGVLAVAAVSKAAEDTKVTAAWFAAMTEGDVGFYEWLTSGNAEAKERLKELGHDVDEIKTKAAGPSIIGSLFGVDDKDNDEWADNMIARYRRIQDESRKSAEQAMKDWQEMRDGLGSGGGPSGGDGAGVDDDDKLKDNLAKRRDAIIQSFETERERVIRIAKEQQAEIEFLREKGKLDAVQANEYLIANEQQKADRLREINEKQLEDQKGYWEKWTDAARENLQNFDDLSKTVIDNFTTGFGNAVEKMVFDAQSLDDALKGIAESIMRGVVNALGQMVAQWIALQAVQAVTGASATAQTVGQAALASAAWAPAAASASLATLGTNAAPASAAITSTHALSKTLSLTGMAHDGIDAVPKTGTWLLEKGERVMTSETSKKLDKKLDGGSGVVVNLYEDASKAGQVQQGQRDDGTAEVNVFVSDIMSNGPRARAMQRAYGLRRQGT